MHPVYRLVWPVKKALLFLILGLALAGALFAGGKGEQDSAQKLAEAERLIEEKDYNRAILLLAEIGRADPDKFDAVQRLMGKIHTVRKDYNSKYQELISVLFDQYDLGRGLEMIRELQAMDPMPNEATVQSLLKAKEGTELVFFLNQFNQLMDLAQSQLKQAQYAQGIETYLGGYTLGKESFEAANYGNIIKNSVEASLVSLKQAAADFKALSGLLEDSVSRLNDRLSSAGLDLFQTEAEVVLRQCREVLTQRRKVEQAAQSLKQQNQQIKKASDTDKYDLFLHFAAQIALGRPTSEGAEGIACVILAAWERSVSGLSERLLLAAAESHGLGLERFGAKDFAPAREALERAGRLYFAALDLQALREMQLRPESLLAGDKDARSLVQRRLPDFIALQLKIKEVRAYQELLGFWTRLAELEGRAKTVLEQYSAARSAVLQTRGDLEALKTGWESSVAAGSSLSVLGFAPPDREELARRVGSEFDILAARLLAADIAYAGAAAGLEIQSQENAFQSVSARYDQGLRYLNGLSVQVETVREAQGSAAESPTRMEKYPDRAQSLFQPLAGELAGIDGALKQILDRWGGEQAYLAGSREVQSQLERGKTLRERIQAMLAAMEQHLGEVRSALLQAERFKREGLLREDQAHAQLAGEKFTQARESVQLAQEAYDQSLSFQEDPQLRRRRDEGLTMLSRQIIAAENAKVVQEVRGFINNGKDLYNRGEFIQAEQVLLKARARWADTNPEENKEITYWLGYARAALQINTGREIKDKDPLYATMLQLFNLAVEDYQAGKELVEKSRIREGAERLNKAQDKLTQIKVTFPYNRDARLLSLSIDQLRDPEGYAAQITRYYNNAVRKIEANPQEAYIDLKDLEQIKSDYPGLQKKLYDLEIQLGMRIPPPDPQKLSRSKSLTEEARPYVERQLIDLYPVALVKLNEALELNPENQKAQDLKDRIQTAAGGRVQDVLSSDDTLQLRQAEELFRQEKYFEARQKVVRLLQNPRNQNYRPLQELKRRIEAKIGT